MAVELEKLRNLILRIGSDPQVENLGLTKLWKLIYFIDVAALRELGRSVTGSEFIRYEHGPVPSRGEKALQQLTREGHASIVQEEFAAYRINRVHAAHTSPAGAFSPEELEIITEICRKYGCENAKFLSEVSHREPAWHYAEHLQKLSPELMLYGQAEDPEGL